LNNGWRCNADKAIRVKLGVLYRSVKERLLADLQKDSRPDHLISAVNQIRNQQLIAGRLGDDFESFRRFMLLCSDGFQKLLDEVLNIYRNFRNKLRELMQLAQEAMKNNLQLEATSNRLRQELMVLCDTILSQLVTIRTDLALVSPSETEAPVFVDHGPQMNQEESNGPPPAKG
jgi:hypothetical protein